MADRATSRAVAARQVLADLDQHLGDLLGGEHRGPDVIADQRPHRNHCTYSRPAVVVAVTVPQMQAPLRPGQPAAASTTDPPNPAQGTRSSKRLHLADGSVER